MSVDSGQSLNKFDARVLEQLACPVCFGVLRIDALDGQIHCAACLRVYPLVDGIPVLIAERALIAEG
jgi:uncharacterized protein YbaR (Trm112 family)